MRVDPKIPEQMLAQLLRLNGCSKVTLAALADPKMKVAKQHIS